MGLQELLATERLILSNGYDLIECLKKLWTEVHNIVQEVVIKTISKKKKCKKAKWLSEEALQIAKKRREAKSKGEKERYTHLKAEFQRISGRDKKAFLSEQCKEIEKTIEWEILEISSRKLEIPSKHFMQRWALIKDSKGIDLTEAENIKKR